MIHHGVVQIAATTRPGSEVHEQPGLNGYVRIVAELLLEDLVTPGLEPALLPVLEHPLVRCPIFRGLGVSDNIIFLHPRDAPLRIGIDPIELTRHAADEEVVIDVEPLVIKQVGQELCSLDDLLVPGGLLVDSLHEHNTLIVDRQRRAQVQSFQPIGPLVIDLDTARGAIGERGCGCRGCCRGCRCHCSFSLRRVDACSVVESRARHLTENIARASMPPEMFRALKPFCSRIRVA